MGDVSNCLFFSTGRGIKNPRKGKVPGAKAQRGVSPARRLPVLPTVGAGDHLGSSDGSAFLFSPGYRLDLEGRTGLVLAPLACAQVWRCCQPLPGSCLALRCLSGGIPAAGSHGGALGLGNLAKGMSESGGGAGA